MPHKKLELYFLLLLLLITFTVTFFIFKPFLYTLFLAIIFATVFAPVHARVLKLTKSRYSLAALISTIIVLIVVVVPLTLLSIQIFQEASQLYDSLINSNGSNNLPHTVNTVVENINTVSPVPIDFTFDINQYSKQGLSWLLQNFGSLFTNVAKALIAVFIFLVALYCLFKDGEKLKQSVIVLSPLRDTYDEMVFKKLSIAVNSVVRGNLTVAVVQGVLTAVGFGFFGIPNMTLWGSTAAVASLIPGFGTSLVIIPGVIYLLATGQVFFAVALLIWGMTAVGLIDNFLGPKLAEKGTRLHPFLILLSILGGIAFFGPLGFLLGPLTLSLLFALFEIYFAISKNQEL